MSRKAVYFIVLIVIGLGILLTGYSLIDGIGAQPVYAVVDRIAQLVMYILIGCYLVSDYAVPHGNRLKWIYFVFALSILAVPVVKLFMGSSTEWALSANMVAAVLIAFLAGELNHLKRNIFLSIAVLALLLVTSVYLAANSIGLADCTGVSRAVVQIVRFSPAVQFLALAVTYIFRYKEHREAGRAADARRK